MRTVVAVQTCLDRNNFSCGCIDGELTEKTVSALKAWQTARGLPATGEVDEPTLRRVGNLEAEFGTVEVTREMISALTPYPTSWRDKAAMRRLNYSTVLEAVAEKGHASEDLIQRLNPGVAWPDPPAGTMLVVPKVWPARYVAAARLVLSLSRKEIQAFDSGGKMVAQFPCSIARDVSKRPVGDLAVVNAASDPVYTFDPSLFAEDAEAATISGRLLIPAGPNNPVGVAWVGLSKPGYGIHGTPRPEDIGKTESHGCFRLANWNAAKLVKMIKVGAPVRVEE
jgi:lipoprotein-anchoring transpeptidase ErfK/SrfK